MPNQNRPNAQQPLLLSVGKSIIGSRLDIVTLGIEGGYCQFYAQRLHDAANGIKARACATSQGFIQAFTTNTAIFGDLRHATRTRNITKGFSELRGVIFFKHNLQVASHFLIIAKMFSNIKSGQIVKVYFFHGLILFIQGYSQRFSAFNVFALTGLITTSEHNDNGITSFDVVHAITRAEMFAHFMDTITKGFSIAKMPILYASQSAKQAQARCAIAKSVKPVHKMGMINQLNHGGYCSLSNTLNQTPLNPFKRICTKKHLTRKAPERRIKSLTKTTSGNPRPIDTAVFLCQPKAQTRLFYGEPREPNKTPFVGNKLRCLVAVSDACRLYLNEVALSKLKPLGGQHHA